VFMCTIRGFCGHRVLRAEAMDTWRTASKPATAATPDRMVPQATSARVKDVVQLRSVA